MVWKELNGQVESDVIVSITSPIGIVGGPLCSRCLYVLHPSTFGQECLTRSSVS